MVALIDVNVHTQSCPLDGGTCLPTGILEVASIGRSLKLVGVDAGFVVSRHVLLDDQ